MKNYFERHHKVFGLIGAIIAIIIAMIYLRVIPEESYATRGVYQLLLVYGHSLCWILLSLASFLWSVKKKNKWSLPLVYTALIAYIVFVSTLLMGGSI